MNAFFKHAGLILSAAGGLAGCMVGPNYQRPPAPMPATFKEAPPGWSVADPKDTAPRGAWWQVFQDPRLDRLERQVAIGNQTLKEDAAAYQNALALLDEAKAGLLPVLGANAGFTRAKSAGGTQSELSVGATASWDLDLWGRIRRQIASNRAAAQASQADLANALLSEQAALANAYFGARLSDALQAVLDNTVANDQRSLTITQNQYDSGVAARSDVLTARTQLESAQSARIAVGVSRAQYEHAAAVLIGAIPAAFSLPTDKTVPAVPQIPAAIPSLLLQRRPDIAAAERTMAAENALIGVAVAAYYPDISLSALISYAGSPTSALFSAGNQLWSAGAAASETIFQGGERGAAVAAARATYDESVATYRQTVLTAFQQVEDALAEQRILAAQARAQAALVADSGAAAAIALNEYQAGTQPYTTVVVAQDTWLAAQQNELSITQSQLEASVALLEALGGGWAAATRAPA